MLPKNVEKFSLGLYNKYTAAWNETDVSAYLELHHDDYEMTFTLLAKLKNLKNLAGMNGPIRWLHPKLNNDVACMKTKTYWSSIKLLLILPVIGRL